MRIYLLTRVFGWRMLGLAYFNTWFLGFSYIDRSKQSKQFYLEEVRKEIESELRKKIQGEIEWFSMCYVQNGLRYIEENRKEFPDCQQDDEAEKVIVKCTGWGILQAGNKISKVQ